MFGKVMWATDGSDAADQALLLAKALAMEEGGDLIVAHCEEHALPSKGGEAFPVHVDQDKLRAKIDHQVTELSKAGISATVQLTSTTVGGVAHAIADIASDNAVDVIVVGTRGLTPLGGLLLGSVTQRLLHIAPCPVLVVPTQRT